MDIASLLKDINGIRLPAQVPSNTALESLGVGTTGRRTRAISRVKLLSVRARDSRTGFQTSVSFSVSCHPIFSFIDIFRLLKDINGCRHESG